MRLRLDKIDIQILATLEAKGRIQNQQLAETVCLSPGACSQRLRRLEQAKLISRYAAEIDLQRLFSAVSIVAIFKMSGQGNLRQVKLLKALEDMPEVVDCFEIAGDADYIVKFNCLSLDSYHQQVTAVLSDDTLSVKKIESYIILHHVKELRRSNLTHLAELSEMI